MNWDDWGKDVHHHEGAFRSIETRLRLRLSISIISGVGWLSFILIWLFFFAGSYNLYQNIALFFLSIFIFIGVNVITWIPVDTRILKRTSMSFVIIFIWLIFLIIWLFFYASEFTFYQNAAVILVSLILVGIFTGTVWIPGRGTNIRSLISGITGFGWLVFLIVWLFTLASDYTIYQNIAVFLVSVLILGGLNAVIWLPTGIHGKKYY